jgi:hypothetical protein
MRRQGRQQHKLPSFTRYLNKVFDFRSASDSLTDARKNPEIPAPAVFRAVFHGFLFRFSSFQELESELATPAFQRWIGADRSFSDDVLRYSLCGLDLARLETMLVRINRTLKRNKAFDPGRVQGRIVAALDGLEVLSSYSRCCETCLERRIACPQPDGSVSERIQYYHRVVGCQIVSSPLKPLLALEWVQPGEGEDTAALRLFERISELYGSRFFDILLLDSLYAQAPVLRLLDRLGWDAVITFKQERRDLYQDALGLFQLRPADLVFEHQQEGVQRRVQLWHAADLPFTEDYPRPVRVVRSQEEVTRQKIQGGKPYQQMTQQQWCWISTLEDKVFPATLLWQLGHLRWKNENNGWNDLTQNWALKHGFLHACKHRPQATSTDGKRHPVPNRGLAAVVLILTLAFNLFSAFVLLHSKLFRRYRPTLLEVARQLYRSVDKRPPPIRSPGDRSPACC